MSHRTRSVRTAPAGAFVATTLLASTAALGQGQVVGWGAGGWASTANAPVSAVFPFAQAAGGSDHSIALGTDGTVSCWGYNYYGSCDVPAGLGSVVQVSAGSCSVALKANGTLVAWGTYSPTIPASLTSVVQFDCGDNSGWLVALRANGTVWTGSGGLLTPPVGLASVVQVAAGQSHAVARKSTGTAVCWGDDTYSQCTLPPFLGYVTQAAAGWNHTVVIAGTWARCWGLNTSGQCTVPSGPEGLGAVTQVAAGQAHSAAIKANGTVVCWGLNTSGQCTVPSGLGTVTKLVAGANHTLALKSDGTAVCWGDNAFGACNVPTSHLSVTGLSGGNLHTLVVHSDGTVGAWGGGQFGQSAVPTGLGAVTQVAAGSDHSVARHADGTVTCWGANSSGQCNVPTGLASVAMVAATLSDSFALLAGGSVVGWGAGAQPPAGLAMVTQIDGGYWHAAARQSNGTAVCWGANQYGQSTVPVTLLTATMVAAGWKHTVALNASGAVVGWGTDDVGQLTPPPSLGVVTKVAAGRMHTVALKEGGTVACWGQLGQSTVPTGLANVTDIAAGDFTTLTLLSPAASSCANPGGAGTATLTRSGATWQDVGSWTWTGGGGPQVPGSNTNVSLGSFGSVSSACSAQCNDLVTRAGTSLIFRIDLSIPMSSQPDHSISVESTAALAGRIWLFASGASVLPLDLDIPVLRCGTPNKSFDLIESTVRAPEGWFLTVVPSMSGPQVLYSLRLQALPGGGETQASTDGTAQGRAIAAEVIDVDNDGYDDLAVAINFPDPPSGLLQILMNDGTGALGSTSQLYDIPAAQLTCLATGDVNGDGLEEAAVGLASGRIHNWRNHGEGDMQAPSSFSTNGRIPLSLAIIPRGGSGSGLAMEAGGYTSGSSSGGSGGTKTTTFNESGTQSGEISTNGSTPTTMVGRGRDVATGGSNSATLNPGESGKVAVLRIESDANGNPVPVLRQTIVIPGIPALMDMADIDGDGFNEIITANQSPEFMGSGVALPVLTVMRGSATGFGAAIPFAPDGASSGEDVSLVDTNNDGVRDIVSVHRTLGTTTRAAIIRLAICRDADGVPCDSNGATFTVDSQTALTDSTQPSFTVRGDLNRQGGDDFFLVDEPPTSALVGGVGSTGRPYLGADWCIGDLDHNASVDAADLNAVLSAWGSSGDSAADFNHDGVVDALDLGTMLGSWGACN